MKRDGSERTLQPLAVPPGHADAYNLTLREPGGTRALWVTTSRRAYAHRPGTGVSEVFAIAFDRDDGPVVVKETLPFAAARFDRSALTIEADACILSPNDARGTVSTGARTVAWDLRLEQAAPEGALLPHRWLYTSGLDVVRIETPSPDLAARGTVRAQEETWTLFGWRGAMVRRFGVAEPSFYAWGHVSSWDEGTDLLVEGMTAPTFANGRLGPVLTPVHVRAFGSRYAMNGLFRIAANQGEVTPRRWKFKAEGSGARIRGEIWAETDDFVGLFAEGPCGEVHSRLVAPLARARVEVEIPGRPAFVAHSRCAALEIGTHDPHHGVRMYV